MSAAKTWHSEPVTPDTTQDLRAWLQSQMSAERCWLLAHAGDGVNWGRLINNQLVISRDAAPEIAPLLSWDTLQQAFIFGESDEIKLWRVGDEWRARRLTETAESDTFDENQLLWGDEIITDDIAPADQLQFTHLRENRQDGFDHVIPLALNAAQLKTNRAQLRVRHFIAYDDNGTARVAASRLVNVAVK